MIVLLEDLEEKDFKHRTGQKVQGLGKVVHLVTDKYKNNIKKIICELTLSEFVKSPHIKKMGYDVNKLSDEIKQYCEDVGNLNDNTLVYQIARDDDEKIVGYTVGITKNNGHYVCYTIGPSIVVKKDIDKNGMFNELNKVNTLYNRETPRKYTVSPK